MRYTSYVVPMQFLIFIQNSQLQVRAHVHFGSPRLLTIEQLFYLSVFMLKSLLIVNARALSTRSNLIKSILFIDF